MTQFRDWWGFSYFLGVPCGPYFHSKAALPVRRGGLGDFVLMVMGEGSAGA